MPIYEFKCKECEAEFSELLTSSSFEIKDIGCPVCHKHKAEKLLSVFAADTKSSGEFTGMNAPSCGHGCGCHNN